MNLTELKENIMSTFQYNMTCTRPASKITPMIWGPPGIGKSEIVYEIAEEIGYEVDELRLNTLNPVDVRGMPEVVNGRAKFTLPFYFPMPGENPKKIIFLDEISTATPMNQNAALELALDYGMGGVKLPIEALIIGAGNREEDRGATFEMTAPLANRLQHFYALPGRQSFVDYALKKGVAEDIVGFIQFKPGLLHAASEDNAFPTPRSWTKLSSLGKHAGKFTETMVSSLVGVGAAGEFMAYLEVKSQLPDVDLALEEGIPFQSKERSVMFSFLTALTYRLNADCNTYRFKNFLKIISVFPLELQAVSTAMLTEATVTKILENPETIDDYLNYIDSFNTRK